MANSESDNTEVRRKLGTAKKLAIAGIIVGIIVIILVVIINILFFVVLVSAAHHLNVTDTSFESHEWNSWNYTTWNSTGHFWDNK